MELLNGFLYGSLLFLTATGLLLIFGLMNLVSSAHGSYFMLGLRSVSPDQELLVAICAGPGADRAVARLPPAKNFFAPMKRSPGRFLAQRAGDLISSQASPQSFRATLKIMVSSEAYGSSPSS